MPLRAIGNRHDVVLRGPRQGSESDGPAEVGQVGSIGERKVPLAEARAWGVDFEPAVVAPGRTGREPELLDGAGR